MKCKHLTSWVTCNLREKNFSVLSLHLNDILDIYFELFMCWEHLGCLLGSYTLILLSVLGHFDFLQDDIPTLIIIYNYIYIPQGGLSYFLDT